jgi:hypothetical protein
MIRVVVPLLATVLILAMAALIVIGLLSDD